MTPRERLQSVVCAHTRKRTGEATINRAPALEALARLPDDECVALCAAMALGSFSGWMMVNVLLYGEQVL